MFTKSKSLLLAMFALLTIVGVFFATNQHKADAAQCGPNSGQGEWKQPYQIDCDGGGNDNNWYYDPGLTKRFGGSYIVFIRKDDTNAMVVAAGQGAGGTRFCYVPKSTVDTATTLAIGSGSSYTDCGDLTNSAAAIKADNNGTGFCSIVKTGNCDYYQGSDSPFAANAKFAEAGPDLSSTLANLNANVQAEKKSDDCNDAAGTLGFLLCPLFESVSNSITNIIGVSPTTGAVNPDAPLMSLLIVRPLQFSSGNTLQEANNRIRDITNAAYVVIFIIIIFASFIDFGQDWIDNYTVKRVLPRLVAAIIFTQFSYLICAFVIDAGNAIGFAIPQLINGAAGASNGINPIQNALVAISGVAANKGVSIFSGLGGFLLAFIFIIAVLVVLIIALVYMIFRLFALYLLVIVAPLAIAASVLPATSKYFKMWGSNLIKLNIMFPLVVAVIAISGVVSQILITEGCSAGANATLCTYFANTATSTAPAASPVQGSGEILVIAGALVPLFALLLIPKCLKLSGEIMAFTAGAVAGRVTGKLGDAKSGVANKGKESVQKQLSEGKAAELRGKFQRGKGSAYARVPGLKRRGARNIAAGGARIGAYKKSLSEPIERMDGESLSKLVQATGGKGKVGEVARGELAKKYNEASERQANRRRNGQPEDPGLNSQMAKMDSALLTAMSKDDKFDVAVHVPETPSARDSTVERIREAAPTAQAKVLGSTRKVESMDAGSVAAILAGRSAAGDRSAGGGSAEIVTALEGIRAELRGAHRTAVEDYLSR